MASNTGSATGPHLVRECVEPAVRSAGLVLEDVEVSRAGARSVVRITVDLPEDAVGDVDLDQVAAVSRSISAALDGADPLPGAYTLEVSSPGVSRPLVERRHFLRARGRIVRLTLTDGGVREGRLFAVDDVVHLDVGDGRVAVPLADVREGRIQVELSRATDADTDKEV